MAYRHEILDELQALKQDATRLLGSRTEEWREASTRKAKDIAADVKAFLSDFRDAVALEEEDIERASPDAPRPRSRPRWCSAS